MSRQPVNFVKMNGLGNKIIVADMRERLDHITQHAAIVLAADDKTNFDQIMAVHKPRQEGTDAYIEIFNSDGSEAGACGNGMRCVVSWLRSQLNKDDFHFESISGVLDAHFESEERITVNMGQPRFNWDQIPVSEEFADTRNVELQIGPIDDPVLHTPSLANIGNPHAVFWINDSVLNYDLERLGPMLENHPLFPDRANITIARVTSENTITIRTWERGAGLTKACGSAACATVVNAARTDRTGRKVTVTLPGGDLEIEWRDDNFIMMSGPVEFEFAGNLDPVDGQWSMDQKIARQ